MSELVILRAHPNTPSFPRSPAPRPLLMSHMVHPIRPSLLIHHRRTATAGIFVSATGGAASAAVRLTAATTAAPMRKGKGGIATRIHRHNHVHLPVPLALLPPVSIVPTAVPPLSSINVINPRVIPGPVLPVDLLDPTKHDRHVRPAPADLRVADDDVRGSMRSIPVTAPPYPHAPAPVRSQHRHQGVVY